MRFNLVHVLLAPPLHTPMGYREVIDTLAWGLQELGHDVTVNVNGIEPNRTNIIVGGQLLRPEWIDHLADDTIIYNLEQIAHLPPEKLNQSYHRAARRLQFWDYNQGNIQILRQLHPLRPPIHVPIGWAPILRRMPATAVQDIDLLMYGVPSIPRLRALSSLSAIGAATAFLCGLYGEARDSLIARAKIIVNVKGVHAGNVFEVVRVSYLMANGKAVVSDIYPDTIVEPDMREAVAFAPFDQLADTCAQLLRDEDARRRLENAGARIMQARDIREPLLRAIAALTSP